METSETKRKYKILPVIDTVHILIDDAILSRNDIDTVPENLGQCNGQNVVHAVTVRDKKNAAYSNYSVCYFDFKFVLTVEFSGQFRGQYGAPLTVLSPGL